MATATATVPVKFHISLNVSDLARSVAYYKILFDMEPAKLRHDYAKFEPEEPPLVLSLEPTPRQPGGSLNHLGLRVTDAVVLVEAQKRLEAAGFVTQREDGVACCYARQTKFWTTDPDHNLWEIYILHEDLEERGIGSHVKATAEATPAEAPAPKSAEPLRWHHVLTDAVPARIAHDDNSLDEAHLQGTFNKRLDPAALGGLLREAHRVLRPGGRVLVHTLVAAGTFTSGMPKLPGPAAMVEYVPQESEPLAALVEAGFVAAHFDKLAETPCFVVDGVEMREMKLTAVKPKEEPLPQVRQVLYKGPLRQVADDDGNVYPRGQRLAISARSWDSLRNGQAADQFVFFPTTVTLRSSCH